MGTLLAGARAVGSAQGLQPEGRRCWDRERRVFLLRENISLCNLFIHTRSIYSVPTVNSEPYYSWPLNETGLRLPAPTLYSQKCAYNFWLPQNVMTNSSLLTGSLINNINSGLRHLLYVTCIIYCICNTCYIYYIYVTRVIHISYYVLTISKLQKILLRTS